MANITSPERKALPKSEFAEPGLRKYPIDTAARAANAKARARQQYNAGKMGVSLFHSIVAKANRKLGKTAAESR